MVYSADLVLDICVKSVHFLQLITRKSVSVYELRLFINCIVKVLEIMAV